MAKTVLITGASTGIGRATAELFAERGWNVVATMRIPDNGADLDQLDSVTVERLDVTDAASIDAAVASAIERFGAVDVLVNNAGYGAFGPLEATPSENITKQFDTNVIGLLEVTKAVLPQMRAQGSGAIVNISSIGGRVTLPLGTLYHGTKWAVEGLSEALSYELESIGIRVKIVEPGVIATDFAGRSFDFSNDESMAEYQPIVRGVLGGFESFMGNASPPSLVAEVIHEAATDESPRLRYLAGEDAEQWLAAREAQGDVAFKETLKGQLGL
jgi:NAD(P)-dependent dehydrogenase (short-subunit alcohol dehydrogenase family)